MQHQITEKEEDRINMDDTIEQKDEKLTRKSKFFSALKKILLYTGAAIAVALVMALLYQIIEYLFVLVVLVIAWLGAKK